MKGYRYKRIVNISARSRLRKIPLKDLSFFCRQMAAMIQAGVPATRAIEICGQAADERLRQALGELNRRIREGCTLSEAMGTMGNVFPELMVRVTEAGEQSGRLPQLFEKLAKGFASQYQLRKKVQGIMTYPAILFAVTAASAIFLFTAVVPQFAAMLPEENLPGITRAMLAVSAFLTLHPALCVFGLAGCLLFVRAMFEIPALRLQGSRLLLHLPAVGPALRLSNGARFASAFSILYGSGVGALESMETAGRLISNSYARKRMDFAVQAVKEGSSFSEVFAMESLFPPAFAAMVAAGEESGQLARLLEEAGEFYEAQEGSAMEQLAALLEPGMILFMGLVVGTIVLSVVIPLYSMYSGMI